MGSVFGQLSLLNHAAASIVELMLEFTNTDQILRERKKALNIEGARRLRDHFIEVCQNGRCQRELAWPDLERGLIFSPTFRIQTGCDLNTARRIFQQFDTMRTGKVLVDDFVATLMTSQTKSIDVILVEYQVFLITQSLGEVTQQSEAMVAELDEFTRSLPSVFAILDNACGLPQLKRLLHQSEETVTSTAFARCNSNSSRIGRMTLRLASLLDLENDEISATALITTAEDDETSATALTTNAERMAIRPASLFESEDMEISANSSTTNAERTTVATTSPDPALHESGSSATWDVNDLLAAWFDVLKIEGQPQIRGALASALLGPQRIRSRRQP